MNRRVFLLSGICLAGVGWRARPLRCADLPRLAILAPSPSTAADPASGNPFATFLEALRELGYADGRNIRLDIRFAENRLDQLPKLAAELVMARPVVIYTHTTPGALAAAGATTSIPIVVGPVGEETMEGLARNFARPVANVTGFTLAGVSALQKCLQLLKEAAPEMSRIGVLSNPDNTSSRDSRGALNAAADQLGLTLIFVESRGAVDINQTLAQLANKAVDGLLIDNDSTFLGDVRARIVAFTRGRHLPSASMGSGYAQDGGLLSLSTDMGFIFRRAAEYVDRIIHGAQPSELPVQRPTKFQLSVNLDTAKALGLTVPPSILARADEVIE
jgi:putative ABC transport system substrate-binding protein